MGEFWAVLFFCLGVVLILLAVAAAADTDARSDDDPMVLVLALFAVLVLGFTTFYVAPRTLGYGHVTSGTRSFDTRLDNGTTYRTVASVKSDAGYVLLVKEYGTQDFYAIRVKTVPPPLFTLVRGNPIAIGIGIKTTPAAPPAK